MIPTDSKSLKKTEQLNRAIATRGPHDPKKKHHVSSPYSHDIGKANRSVASGLSKIMVDPKTTAFLARGMMTIHWNWWTPYF